MNIAQLNPSQLSAVTYNDGPQLVIAGAGSGKTATLLSKVNYVVHTDAIKSYIVPTLTEEQKKFVYAEEAEFVADQIVELLDNNHYIRKDDGLRPIEPDDIVILLRSPKTNGWYYHDALAKRGIRTVSSAETNILITDEVEWLRSLLQTINNPFQDIPLIAAMTGPVFGFTADDLARIRSLGRYDSFRPQWAAN